MPPDDGTESAIQCYGVVNSYGSTGVERVCPNVFWGKSKYGCANPSGIIAYDCEDFRVIDRSETLVSARVVSDQSAPQAPMFEHA